MSRSRAATPAGKRRSAAARSHAPSRSKPRKARAARGRAPRRGRTRTRAIGRPRGWRAKALVVALVAVAATALYFLWLRDSSLVAISDVEVVGARGSESAQIADELTAAGETMTTLNVDHERLREIAAGFASVESISADARFPHGLRIEVTERRPKLLAKVGGREVPIAADGGVLAGVDPGKESLPVVELDRLPPGGMLGGAALDQALVVGAAPKALAPLIARVGHSDDHGVELKMRGDVRLRFGTGAMAEAKWEAVAAVLADPELETASYVDVQVPSRPVAGGQPAEPVEELVIE